MLLLKEFQYKCFFGDGNVSIVTIFVIVMFLLFHVFI